MVLLAFVLACSVQDPAAGPSLDRVRASIERSLPFLEREGVAWIRDRACLSCHHVPFLLWSHREARERGVAVDSTKLAEWSEWSRSESLSHREKLKLTDAGLDALKGEGMPADTLAKLAPLGKKAGAREQDLLKDLAKSLTPEEFHRHRAGLLKHASREKGDGGGPDAMAQLLLAGVYGSPDPSASAFVASTRTRIAELQQADGSWKPGGQLFQMKRPAAEATEVTTMWALLAQDPSEKTETFTKALAFLKKAGPGKTSEWLAAGMLLEKTHGEPEAYRVRLKELLSRQNPDGGWAWLPGNGSDAFATGQILHALSLAESADPAALARARKFLIGTQAEDGSWAIPHDAVSKVTKPERIKGVEPIYRYWGTAWATIGLARTLPGKP